MPEVENVNDEPVYLLSLDGGGIRGISELVILHEIMKRLQKTAGLADLPKPRDYFHLIGGTSTGGLIAIMLGRMGMTTQEAIECYDTFAEKVFRKTNRRWDLTFGEKALEKLIQEIVDKRKLDSTVMIDEGRKMGLTFVCAVTRSKMEEAYLFRTYRGSSNHAHNVEIWEAARATTSAPKFFNPIEIKVEARREYYYDGALAYNNPTKLVLDEAESHLGSDRKLGFLLSLGTGLKATDTAADVGDVQNVTQRSQKHQHRPGKKLSGSLLSRDSFPVLKHVKMSVTDSERTHHELDQQFRNIPNAYFRLNLDKGAANIGLHKYKKMKILREATERYLKNDEVSAAIDKMVHMLYHKEGVEMPLEATCRATSYEAFKHAMAQEVRNRSIASPQFTGRTAILRKMDRHFCERKPGSSPRRHLRIWGMGGVGKTQIALKFRDLHGSRFDRVFWINAATSDSIYESFRKVTAEIYGGNPSRPNVAGVLNWLGQKRQEEWLLVFDNNDSDSTDISKYIPEGDTGNILFTSRRKDIKPSLNHEDTFAVDVMDEADAVELLLRASKLENHPSNGSDRQHITQIIKELGYLPLAIDQAGSYVDMQDCTFQAYLFEFREGRKELMEDTSMGRGAFHDNPAVYGTFELSYKALKRKSEEDSREGRAALNALRILSIFCFYHNENIMEQIISRAALYNRLDTEFLEDENSSISPLPLLDRKEGGEWDARNLSDGIRILRSYSLIKKSILNDEWHSMHVLIHSWARERMDQQTLIFQRRAAREILFFSVYRHSRLSDEVYASQVLPHLRACLKHGGTEHLEWMRKTEQEGKLARTLVELGLWQDATACLEDIVSDRANNCSREDWTTIAGLWDLGKAYRDSSRLKESEMVFEDIKTLLAKCPQADKAEAKVYDIHIDLAKVYVEQAEYEKAKDILSWIVQVEKPYGWKSGTFRRAITTLATVLRIQGDTETALGLESFILDECMDDEKIGPGHRMTMSCISHIAALRSEMGLHQKASEMWREVLDIDQDLRGKEHPITLQSKRNVATGSANLDQLWEAEDILRDVLDVSERVLGKDHLDTLATMDQLAGVLVRRAKNEEAEELWKLCLEGRMTWLGEGHPLTERTKKALERMAEGTMVFAQQDFEADGLLYYGDSNFVSHAERDRYLH